MTRDKEALFNYGLTDLDSFLDRGNGNGQKAEKSVQI